MMRTIGLISCAAALAAAATVPVGAQCVQNVPHLDGTWDVLPYGMPINPISATLLHSGKVLIVSGSENDAYNNSSGAVSYRAALWDPTGTDDSSIVTQQVNYDLFCSGTAQLPHGRTLTIGGSASYGFTGEKRASFFDPATQRFAQSPNMADGRWYGSATELGDGRIMALSGTNAAGTGTNNTTQIFDLKNAPAGWGSTITNGFSPPLFPRSFLLPNGTVFFTAHGSGTSIATAWIFDPVANSWSSSIPKTQDRQYGAGVILPLLPPSYKPKIMMFGGGTYGTPPNDPNRTTEMVDLSAASPAWTPMQPMSAPRIEVNAVLLPDGKVVLSGGSRVNETPDAGGKQTDIYDSAANTMTQVGTANYSRLYHSTAILLPDATVASMGSNPGGRGSYERAIEIYTPPYLYDANDRLITTDRPSITSVPSAPIAYVAAFPVSYTSTNPIASAVLVRPGSTTHSCDMDQRVVGLCGPSPQPPCSGSGSLSLTAPPSGNVAPPGFYMLFLIDTAGVPSIAQWVDFEAVTAAPPVGSISSPPSDQTINAGQSVSFSSGVTATKYSWVFPGGSPATSSAKNPGNVTYSTAGTYVASLTVLDAANNSDASPPLRKITVLPTGNDFTIAVTPASQTVTPGQSNTYTVTVTAIHSFSGSVALTVDSESGFPPGITSGGFSPASISGSGTSTLTMNTSSSTVPYATSLSVHGTSGSTTHTASTTLDVRIAPPTGLTATPVDSAVNLSWNPSAGASGYNIGRSIDGGYESIGCQSGTSYSDTGLTNGTTYTYSVLATFTGGPNAGGASADSADVPATPCVAATYAGMLTAAKSGGSTVWNWTAGGATLYDLMRGDLGTLIATGGDFHAALDAIPPAEPACLANDTSALTFTDTNAWPTPGNGVFAILRPVTAACIYNGTLDDGSPSEVGSRDAGVAASSRSCP
jgi:hypothetical protein